MSSNNVTTVSATMTTTRNDKGQIMAGYVGTAIRVAEAQQERRREVDNRVDMRLFLWVHGYEGVTPSEIFA